MTEDVVEALDICQVTYRKSVAIIAAITSALGHDLQTIILNKSSFNRKRKAIRKKKAENIKDLYKQKDIKFVEGLWDSKIIRNKNRKKIDRLPVLVSNNGEDKISDVPALKNGKGVTQAEAIYDALYKWGLLDKLEAVCCDTTNSNLGCRAGAAKILEIKLEKSLLCLPCRHHMLELVLAAAYKTKMPSSREPDVTIFKVFRENLDTIDMTRFNSGVTDINPLLKDEIPTIKAFIHKFLNEQLPRTDYKELLELCLMFLGTDQKIQFRRTAGCHHARWMAKAIYSLKMYLLRESRELPLPEANLFSFCQFIVFVYIRAWYTCPVSVSAPNNYLQLIKKLDSYKTIDENISKATMSKISNHLWYLSPEYSSLAFFDDNITLDTKRKMVTALKKKINSCSEQIKKYPANRINDFIDKEIDFFITHQSLKLFDRFNLNHDFLSNDPASWCFDQNYQSSKIILMFLRVINDASERAVKLTEEYINILTVDQDKKKICCSSSNLIEKIPLILIK